MTSNFPARQNADFGRNCPPISAVIGKTQAYGTPSLFFRPYQWYLCEICAEKLKHGTHPSLHKPIPLFFRPHIFRLSSAFCSVDIGSGPVLQCFTRLNFEKKGTSSKNYKDFKENLSLDPDKLITILQLEKLVLFSIYDQRRELISVVLA